MKQLKALLMALAVLTLLTGGAMADGHKKEIELLYVEWSSEIASTNVVKAALEQMGYDVEMTAVSAAAMWMGLATGDGDALVAAWLPTTHGHYLEKVSNRVEDLGPNLIGTRIGLVVPEYSAIKSVGDMRTNPDAVDGKIIGIDPGAGLMSATEKAIEQYGLEDIKLVEGSGATMTAALQNAVKRNEDIVVTGWTPHWKFAKFDLRYVKDPKGVFGGEEKIHTIARMGLKEDMPDAYALLDNFFWSPEDMGQVMLWIQDGMSPEDAAERFLKENPALLEKWMQ